MFDEILKAEIKRNGYTQQQLSEETGINAGLISRYVTGGRLPNMKNLYKLSEALSFSTDVVLRIMYGGD